MGGKITSLTTKRPIISPTFRPKSASPWRFELLQQDGFFEFRWHPKTPTATLHADSENPLEGRRSRVKLQVWIESDHETKGGRVI